MGRRRGAGVMTVGLVVAGVSIYGFLSIGARDLGADRYAVVAVLWALVFTLGQGLFLPFEQEVTRALVARRTRGEGGAPVVGRVALAAGAAGLALGLLALLAIGPLAVRLFDGSRAAVLALALALPGYAAFHVTRGTLVGRERFSAAATLMGGEGVLRLAGAGLVAWQGLGLTGYVLAIGLAPVVAVAVTWAVTRPGLAAGPPYGWGALGGVVGALLVTSVCSTALINVGPVVARLAGAAPAVVAGLFAALLLVRPPLYVWQGVTVALLPRLTHAARTGARARIRRLLLEITAGVAAAAVVGVGLALLVGPEIGRLLYGSSVRVGASDLALLAVATCGFMLALALNQGLLALDRAPRTAVAWALGLAVALLVSLPAPAEPRQVELALLAGVAVAIAVLAWPLVRLAEPVAPVGTDGG